MFIIMGGTGHVGSAAATALLKQGQDVTIVTHDPDKVADWESQGAKVAVVDVYDPDALRSVFQTGERAFLLNPPAAPNTDTDQVEKETVRLILEALKGSGLEKVVAESTYGAKPGDRLGDLNTLHDLEAGLEAQDIPFAIIRAAYYFSNFDGFLKMAKDKGVLPTMFPADLKVPMVAPDDLGQVAARLLTDPLNATGVFYVEGPTRYSAANVAAAFAKALGREVEPVATPREDWEVAYKELGFSDEAAFSYARMTAATVDGQYPLAETTTQGSITLQAYINDLAQR